MTAPTVVQAHDVRPPSGAAAPTARQRIAGTGATAVSHVTELRVGEMATLAVGRQSVRVGWGSSQAAAEADCTSTSVYLSGGARFDWLVSESDRYVALLADDGGATPFEGHVWTSSGAR